MPIPLPRLLPLVVALSLPACVPIPIPIPLSTADLGPVRPWPASATCAEPPSADADRQALLALVNQARGEAGLAPLRPDPALTAVAQAHACENAATGSISHEGPDGSQLMERIRRGGLTPALVAENTGLFSGDAAHAFAWWMSSPHHRDNILRPGVSRVGIGIAPSGTRSAWVLDFMAAS